MRPRCLRPSPFEARLRSHLRVTTCEFVPAAHHLRPSFAHHHNHSDSLKRIPQSKEGGGAPTGAYHPLSAPHSRMSPSESAGRGSASSGMRSPIGASPRRSSRRPNARTQPRPRFTRNTMRRSYLRLDSRLSGAPRTPVVMPEGTMPGPPESGTQLPPAGTALAPWSGVSRGHVPHRARFFGNCNKI